MSYHIKLGLNSQGDNEGLNDPGDAEGFPKSPEAFQSTLTENKATATGGRWVWSKLGDVALVLTPPTPETGLPVMFRVVSSPGGKQLRRNIGSAPFWWSPCLGLH